MRKPRGNRDVSQLGCRTGSSALAAPTRQPGSPPHPIWNELLSGHIDGERAERLANHPAFEGPDAEFMRARAARRRGDIGAARTLIMMCLERLPGSQQFAEFAEEVGADLPARAREMRAERAAVQAQLAQAYQGGPVSSA